MSEVIEYDISRFDRPQDTSGLHIRFYMATKKNEAASAEAGRLICEDKEYIEILAPGNANNIIRRPVVKEDKFNYRDQYERFKAGDAEQIIGTPLAEVAWIARSQVEELLYLKVRTLEQLAEVSDQFCSGIPGMYELKRKAAAYVNGEKDDSRFTQMHAEMEAMRRELAALKNLNEHMPVHKPDPVLNNTPAVAEKATAPARVKRNAQ
jgi:hypothetical protein